MSSMQYEDSDYAMDYSGQASGVLDLSRNRRMSDPLVREASDSYSSLSLTNSPEQIIKTEPVTHYIVNDLKHSGGVVEDRYSYKSKNSRSPSYYAEASETSKSPSQHSSQNSPNYATCYPGTEHLSQYVVQAAYQQQLLLQQKPDLPKPKSVSKSVESDAISETGSDGSHNSNMDIFGLMSPGKDGKMGRPFKLYPKNPLRLAASYSTVDTLLDRQSAEKYSVFRRRMLDEIRVSNGGHATVSNPKMRRTVNTHNNNNNNCYGSDDGTSKFGQSLKNDTYTERRKKNNEAAKKSRDRRRIKEDEIAIRAAFLERENIELKFELVAARKQLARKNGNQN